MLGLAVLCFSPAKADEGYFETFFGNQYMTCGYTDKHTSVELIYQHGPTGGTGTLEVERYGKRKIYDVSILSEKTTSTQVGVKKRPHMPRIISGVACRLRSDIKVTNNCKPSTAEGECTVCSESECDHVSWTIKARQK